MGSLFKPKTTTIPTPQQADYVNTIDNVNNVKTTKVKQPDGTYALVTDALPLSAEDQAYQDALKAESSRALTAIDNLANKFDISQVPGLQDALKAYRDNATIGIEKGVQARATSEEKNLARFGQGDSTGAVQTRALRGEDQTLAFGQLGRDLATQQQTARQQEIANQTGLYALATGQTNTLANQQTAAAQAGFSAGTQQQNAQQQYNNTLAGIAAQNAANKQAASQAGLSNLAALGGLAAKAGLAYASGGASLAGGL